MSKSKGTRLLWSLALLAILGSVVLRVRHARLTAAAAAPHNMDMHEATGFVEDRLAAVPATRLEAETLRYARDTAPAIRHAALDTLAKLHSPAAVDAMEQAFADSDSEVRKRAMENLVEMDKPRGLRLLLTGLRDDDSWIREDAATQLNVRIGRTNSGVGKTVVPMLMRAITDPDENVAATAIRALSKLTGNAWRFSILDSHDKRGPVIARWQQWWQTAQAHWPVSDGLTDVPAKFPTRSDAAPAFDVTDVNGKTFRSDNLKGHVTLINFWGSWCGPCQAEIPSLVKINQQYRDRNVVVVGLAVAEKNRDSLQTWCSAHGVAYRQAMASEEVRQAFGGIEEVPVSILIDPKGNIRYQWDGDRDFNTFQAAVERLLKEQG